jgi:hypothetical protein
LIQIKKVWNKHFKHTKSKVLCTSIISHNYFKQLTELVVDEEVREIKTKLIKHEESITLDEKERERQRAEEKEKFKLEEKERYCFQIAASVVNAVTM